MVSHDLLCSAVTNQIAFDQRDSNKIPKAKGAMDYCDQALQLAQNMLHGGTRKESFRKY